jgi:hypothetical protein
MPKFVPRPKPEPNYIPTEEEVAEQQQPQSVPPVPPEPESKDED